MGFSWKNRAERELSGSGCVVGSERWFYGKISDNDWYEEMLDETAGFLPGHSSAMRVERMRAHVASQLEEDEREPGDPRELNRFEAHEMRAARGGGLVDLNPKHWFTVVHSFGDVCLYCQKAHARLSVDHLHPVSLGGDHALWNVVPACRSCNSSKGDRELEAWAEWKGISIEGIYKRLADGQRRVMEALGESAMSPSFFRTEAGAK